MTERMFERITNAELAVFLRGAKTYFERKVASAKSDEEFWAGVANAERCEIAAERLENLS